MSNLRIVLPCLLPAALLLGADSGAPIAFVSDVQGQVRLVPGSAIARFQELGSGQKLELEKGATLVLVQLRTGDEWSFTGPGKLAMTAGLPTGLSPTGQRRVPALQGTIQLKPGAFAQASITLRETRDSSLVRVSPAGPVLLEPIPTFRWADAGAGASYRFSLKDGQGQPLLELGLDTPSLTVPEHLALQEGQSYLWSLDVTDATGHIRSGHGELKLLPKAQRDALAGAKPGAGAPVKDRVLYAAMLQALGLEDEARSQWQGLAKDCPGDPALARMAGQGPGAN